jgi:hypothetical protein
MIRTSHEPRATNLLVLAVLFVFALACPASAQDTHLLVITGVGGDDEHSTQFHQWATTIIEAAKERGGLTDDTITYLGSFDGRVAAFNLA